MWHIGPFVLFILESLLRIHVKKISFFYTCIKIVFLYKNDTLLLIILYIKKGYGHDFGNFHFLIFFDISNVLAMNL